MTTTNFTRLSVGLILELADGDLDDQQLAHRLVLRLILTEKQIRVGLSESEALHLDNLTEVTDRELAAVMG